MNHSGKGMNTSNVLEIYHRGLQTVFPLTPEISTVDP